MNRFPRAFGPALLVAALVLVAVPAMAATWDIDPVHSVLDFKIRHLFSKTGGTFDQWEGTLEFDGENLATLGAEVTIQAQSINTQNDDRDEHLRSPDFFDVEQFPTITFVSKRAESTEDGWVLVGDFTMHGVTREVAIPFEFHGSGEDPWGNRRAGFSGSLEIDRKEFGLVYNKTLDQGGLLLGDEVEIELEIEAVEATPGR
jgi:polyisoprenoid-binding protein YceI